MVQRMTANFKMGGNLLNAALRHYFVFLIGFRDIKGSPEIIFSQQFCQPEIGWMPIIPTGCNAGLLFLEWGFRVAM